MTFLLSFLASLWKLEFGTTWHRKVADAPPVRWLASVFTHQINFLSYFTGSYSDANTFKRICRLKTATAPSVDRTCTGRKSEFWAVTKTIPYFFILFWKSCYKQSLLAGTAATPGDLELDLPFLDHIISDFEIKIRSLWHKIRFLWKANKSCSWTSSLPLKILRKEMFQFEFFREKFRLVIIFSKYFYLPLRQEINEVW